MYFDYGIPVDGDPNVVHLYEVYEDEAAYKEHKASAHLKDYVEKAEALTSSTTTMKLLTLAQYGSVNCNYAGECELSGEWD
jgi:quinol monooxygenase YgiN|tara:strand:+ start:537 stop:779 length:243 start_codon:yes stop_codon:yes gene_type:complete